MIDALYSDGETATLHPVRLERADRVLRIVGTGIDLEWPVRGLEHLPDRPDGTVMLGLRGSDARLAIAAADVEALRAQFPRLLDPRQARRGTLILAGSLTGLAASIAGFIVFGLPALSLPLAHMVPPDVEMRLGEQSNQLVGWFTQECTADPAAQAALDELGDRLHAVAESPFAYRIRVVDADFPNAFALPGGRVIVTDELIELMQSPDELAGVLAHETAHVAQRHVMAAQLREMGAGVLLDFLLGGGSGLGQELARSGASLDSLRHTRRAETEADTLGLGYLAAADFNPEGMADFFDRLDAAIAEAQAAETADDAETAGENEAADETAATGEAETDFAGDAPEPAIATDRESWLSAVMQTHPDTAARARSSREAATGLAWSGRPALSDEAWQSVRSICADEAETRQDTPMQQVRNSVDEVLRRIKPNPDTADEAEVPETPETQD